MIIETFITTAKKNFDKTVLEDSTGMSLTFGQTLTGSILLSRHIRKFKGENVALLFPASVGGALAHIATSLAGKVPVGVNFLASAEEMEWVINTCEVKTIFTSKKFVQKAEIPIDHKMIFIEDLKARTSKLQKTLTYFLCKYKSSSSLIHKFKKYDGPHKTAIILFTSGSESRPKGVPLTNNNIYASVQNYNTVFEATPEDKILGTLPFFHVFGFAVCLWMPLMNGISVAYHPNPTDYEKLGKIVHKYKVTMLLGTSTLYRGFMKKWKKEQVSSVRLAFAGAEKLNQRVREKFYEKLGINILEGYGVTESCSCATVNYPHDFRNGSVGKPLSNVQCKIVDPETYEGVPDGEDGLILIKSPTIMEGYYKSPELTRQAFHDSFYITGDIGKMDNGFLYITDRLKRFAKIGGELVPLTPIEDKLSNILDEYTDDEKRKCAVVNVPHPQKGEQIIAFVVEKEPDKLALNKKLDFLGQPNLSQPDHYIPIDAIPMLPSGKVDYKSMKQTALKQFTDTA